jgi:hypothetical protein
MNLPEAMPPDSHAITLLEGEPAYTQYSAAHTAQQLHNTEWSSHNHSQQRNDWEADAVANTMLFGCKDAA